MAGTTIRTIGHSTRSLAEFVAMLVAHGVRSLVDVRTIPKSRRHPHFALDALSVSLPALGIGYTWLNELGGLRKPVPHSRNGAWRNASFRGYADYMQTSEFAAGVERLIALAEGADVAIMCSEAVPWRCHRSLIGDALLVRGVSVLDIMSATNEVPHELTSFARVDGDRVSYPGEQPLFEPA